MSDEAKKVVLDSFAWLEYLLGTCLGERVRSWIDERSSLTPSVVLAELSEKHQRLRVDFGQALKLIGLKSRVVSLDAEIGVLAGRLNFERKKRVRGWGMIDSMILATARTHGLKVVTGDPHFKDLKGEVIMLQ